MLELGAAISEVRSRLAHVRELSASAARYGGNDDDDDESPAHRPRVKLTPVRQIRTSLLALAAQANNPNAVQPLPPPSASGLHEYARETGESWGESSLPTHGESELARRF